MTLFIGIYMGGIDWCKLASATLKAELKRRSIGYEQLVILLDKIGVQETHASILNKMSRGSFQFAFFLQCAAVIGIKNLRIDDLIAEMDNQQLDRLQELEVEKEDRYRTVE